LFMLNSPHMKKYFPFIVVILLMTFTLTGHSQEYHVRIGFIGNSITYGAGLNNPTTDSYPAQLGVLLRQKYGDTCIVNNFGISSRTMLKHGDYPIWNDAEFKNCWNLAPEILLICLGTNDTKPQNWDLFKGEFLDDYMSMIDTFKVRNPYTKFLVCYPCPAYDIVWGIREELIVSSIMPLVDSVLEKTDAVKVDFHTPLLDSVSLFPDKIHPNLRGSAAMARILLNTIIESDIIHKVETGLTFINTLKTDKKVLAVKDSATLSWTTINADTVTLDGQLVPANGSLKVAPRETRIYTLLAKGEKSVDSMKLEQQVYQPALTRLSITPKNINIYQGDSIDLTLSYYDQINKLMADTVFNIDWSITEGYGVLINKTGTSVTYVADSAIKAIVTAASGDITTRVTVNIKVLVNGISQSPLSNELRIFPNPGDDLINLQLVAGNPTSLRIQLFDLKGALMKEEHHYISVAGTHNFQIGTEDLDPGIFIFQIQYAGKQVTGKITKMPSL
jgi:acyl-CoA thioesterase-1